MSEHVHDDCIECLRRDNERLRKELDVLRASEPDDGLGIVEPLSFPKKAWPTQGDAAAQVQRGCALLASALYGLGGKGLRLGTMVIDPSPFATLGHIVPGERGKMLTSIRFHSNHGEIAVVPGDPTRVLE